MYNNQDIFTITGRNNINPNIVDNNNLEYSSNYSISNIGNSTYVLTDNDYDNIYTSKATEIGSKFASFNDDRILNINNQIQNQYNMFSLDDAMNMESPGYITYEILNPAYEQISGLLNHGTEYGFTKDGNYFIFPQGYTSYNFYLGDRVTYTGEIEDPESQA